MKQRTDWTLCKRGVYSAKVKKENSLESTFIVKYAIVCEEANTVHDIKVVSKE